MSERVRPVDLRKLFATSRSVSSRSHHQQARMQHGD
jgi:hypothetical protein